MLGGSQKKRKLNQDDVGKDLSDGTTSSRLLRDEEGPAMPLFNESEPGPDNGMFSGRTLTSAAFYANLLSLGNSFFHGKTNLALLLV